jgi:UDP-N-acetylmuramoyl-L-alanyl-D-glutamate--2,6-diaminopimelate ligase
MARNAALEDLAHAIPVCAIHGDADVVVTGIEYDSRLISAGDLFVAIPGDRFDGHDYIPGALSRGAVAVMVERPGDWSVPQLVVGDTRATLPFVAATFFEQPSRDLSVIGITGTDGKTTTSYLVDWILRSAGHTTGMVGTVSVRIGKDVVDHETRQTTPESLDIQRYLRQMVDSGARLAVIEATSHGLDLHRLDEVQFAVGAVTNITHEHLEHHKTIAAYRRAKAILFERVAAIGGHAIINLDDPGAREMLGYSGGARVLTYSAQDTKADIYATEIKLLHWGSRFDVVIDGSTVKFELPMVGDYNVMNALCAIAIAHSIELPLDAVSAALASAPPVPGRMENVERGQPFSVIVDYAHTPESLTKVLTLLRGVNAEGRIICVSGSAGDRDRTKRPLQGEVCARHADVSVFTSEDPRREDAGAIIDEIAAGAVSAGAREGRDFHKIVDRREAIRFALSLARPGDCLLLAGKGHERSIFWGDEKVPWHEAGVAAELLGELGYGG